MVTSSLVPKARWSGIVSQLFLGIFITTSFANHVIASLSHVPVLGSWNSSPLKPVLARGCRHIPSSFINSSTTLYPCYYLLCVYLVQFKSIIIEH